MSYYVGPHLTQGNYSWITRTSGCTWTSGATGVATVTGGRHRPSPDYIHSLLPRWQETDPGTPGWSMQDLQKALGRYGMTFSVRSGKGWADVIAQLRDGRYVVLQGDSDQFSNATCSGAFDGNHAIGVNPRTRYVNGLRQWWIDDPICPSGRYEYEAVLRRYAQKLYSTCLYGAFGQRVPQVGGTTTSTATDTGGNVAIRYAGVTGTSGKMQLAAGQALYNRPGGTRVTAMSRSSAVPHVGLAGAVNGKAWRAVVVGTKWSYSDGKPHRTVLYVPASAGKVVAA